MKSVSITTNVSSNPPRGENVLDMYNIMWDRQVVGFLRVLRSSISKTDRYITGPDPGFQVRGVHT